MSSLINFYPKIPFFKDNLVITRRKPIQVAAAPTTCNLRDSKYQSQTFLQLKNLCKDPSPVNYGFDQLTFIPNGLMSDSISIDVSMEKEVNHQQEVEIEGRELMQRLESLIERMRVSEMEKLMARTKGEVLIKEKRVVEMMSVEIVNKIFEKPFKYLRYGDGNLEDKIKDLNALVEMFECSFLKEEKKRSKGCLKNSHP